MKLTGVTCISFDPDFMRNQLFLFDELLVLNMEKPISLRGDFEEVRDKTTAELDFLAKKGLVRFVSPIAYSPERELPHNILSAFDSYDRYSATWKAFNTAVHQSEHYWQLFNCGFSKTEADALSNINQAVRLQLRAHTILANVRGDQFAFCSDHILETRSESLTGKRTSLVSVLFDKIPIIPDMPYDEVIDFRNAPKVKQLHERLKAWISESEKIARDPLQLRAEVESALKEYEEFATQHATKKSLIQIEIIFKLPLTLIESFLKVSPSQFVSTVIDLRRRSIELQEQEHKAPGAHFAYIREIGRLGRS